MLHKNKKVACLSLFKRTGTLSLLHKSGWSFDIAMLATGDKGTGRTEIIAIRQLNRRIFRMIYPASETWISKDNSERDPY